MKQLIFFLFLIICSTTVFNQAIPQIDSLKQLIPQKKDTALVHLYEELERLYFQYRLSNDSIEKYFNLSMELANEIGYEEVAREFSYRSSLLSYRKGEYENAVKSIKAYILEREEENDLEQIVKGKSTLGSFYYKQIKFEEAVSILLETIELSEEIEDKRELYLIYNRLASIHQEMDDFAQSTKYYRLAKEYIQHIPAEYIPTSEITLFHNIATNFYNQNEWDSTRYYTDLVLEKARKIDYQNGINLGLSMQMYMASEKEEYEQVLGFANQLLVSYEKSKSMDLEWTLDAFRHKAIALTHLSRYNEALEVSREMEALAEQCEILTCKEKVTWIQYFINRERGNYEQ
ncbi:MAG: tetratricopeptide repeat protein, partial [Bacteroidota bacterium]